MKPSAIHAGRGLLLRLLGVRCQGLTTHPRRGVAQWEPCRPPHRYSPTSSPSSWVALLSADDIAEWVRRSRSTQELPEKVVDPDTIAALANLVRIALDTEEARQGRNEAWSTTPST